MPSEGGEEFLRLLRSRSMTKFIEAASPGLLGVLPGDTKGVEEEKASGPPASPDGIIAAENEGLGGVFVMPISCVL